jgi:bifunctional ADP-heptose synthase (sugar kinase/adenylyltransferase)
MPAILAKGSNYPAGQVAGADIVANYGGHVVLVPVTEPVSASGLIQRIKKGAGG